MVFSTKLLAHTDVFECCQSFVSLRKTQSLIFQKYSFPWMIWAGRQDDRKNESILENA